MWIPIGMAHSASVKGACRKDVHCERCHCEYLYFAQRTGRGSGFAPLFLFGGAAADGAERGAHQNLQKALAKAIDLAPCPHCGHLQEFMIRAKRVKIVQIAAIGAFALLVPAMILATSIFGTTLAPDIGSRAAVGTALDLVLCGVLAGIVIAIFNPNQGRLFPFTRGTLQQTVAAQVYDEQVALEYHHRRQELALRAGREPIAGPMTGPALASGPDTRTPEQKRADAKARRDAEMARIAQQAKQQNF